MIDGFLFVAERRSRPRGAVIIRNERIEVKGTTRGFPWVAVCGSFRDAISQRNLVTAATSG